MVLVSTNHSFCAIHIACFPAGIGGKFAQFSYMHHLVSFNIGLFHNIEAIFVTQIQKINIRRIVRGSDSVDIVLFHHGKVSYHILVGNTTSGLWIPVMAVYTFEFNRLAVYKE